ncbi:GNAT family N-acetyltransferase, partial [Pseudonocardia sp. McavD-2-B]|uniref:GNAT family N-acetyltransferase n=1 Tax=Pseudonocardia sp. McavD-2-B TaxID=2954499 RepID=UPI0020982A24
QGAGRVVDALATAVGTSSGREARVAAEERVLAGVLRARPARAGDAELLLAWRNDPGTRRWSRSHDEVDLATHRRWLAGSLDSDDRLLLVVDDARGPVGTVRWDRADAAWEVSITVAPERRGEGLAGPLLRAGEDALRARTGAEAPVTAVVHTGDDASARLFARAGYGDPTGPDADGFRTLHRVL